MTFLLYQCLIRIRLGVQFLAKDRHLMNFWPIWARGKIHEVNFSANLLRNQERKQIPKIFKKQKYSLLTFNRYFDVLITIEADRLVFISTIW